jgi:hypothetical protein
MQICMAAGEQLCKQQSRSVSRQDSRREAAADAQMTSRSADQAIMGDTRRMREQKNGTQKMRI